MIKFLVNHKISTVIFFALLFLITVWFPENSQAAIADIRVSPSSGVAPLEVRVTCSVAFDTSVPSSYTMDFGDGSAPVTINSSAYSRTFVHTYQYGFYKPICKVRKTIGTQSSTDYGKLIVAKWKFKTRGEIDTTPVMGNDGELYVGSDDGILYALDAQTGEEIWQFQTGGPIKSSPAVDSSGTIYFGSSDNYFYAVRQNGGLKWSFNIGDYIFSSPAISFDDRTIYVGASDNHLYAINTSGGGIKWSFPTNGKIISSPALGFDGIEDVVYFGSLDKKFYALNANTGALKWTFEGDAAFYASPAIHSNGQIYVGECATGSEYEYNFKFYSLNVDGSKRWEVNGGAGFFSSPAIGSDGRIYAGSWDGTMYALNANGSVSWSSRTSPLSDINSSPAIDAHGVAYVGSKNGNFYAFEAPGAADHQSRAWVFKTDNDILESSPVMDEEGTIYFGSRDKCVYAINPGDTRPADSAWPMFRQGPGHKGVFRDVSIPAIISAVPERNSINISVDLKTIVINFSPEMDESKIDVDSFQLVKVNPKEADEKIEGYAFLDYVRYNNSGYHLTAIFTRLNDDTPLEFGSEYKASIKYSPADASQETGFTTFNVSFKTETKPIQDPDPDPKGDFSCFIKAVQ